MGRKAVAIGSVSGYASRVRISNFSFIGLTRNEEAFTQRMRVGICCTQKPPTMFVSVLFS